MARGWESKSVESQIEDARGTAGPREGRSRTEIERERKRESLEMSRRNVVRDLASARTDAHRAALENALQFLDAELERLG